MPTKGPSMRYGNTNGAHHRGKESNKIKFPWARGFIGSNAPSHFNDHGKELGITNEKDYVAKGVHFANTIDRKHFKSVVSFDGQTYKYDPNTQRVVVVTKDGYIRTYYSTKGSGGFYYYPKKGERKWIKV